MFTLEIFSRPGVSRGLKLLAVANVFGLVYFLTIFSAIVYLVIFHVVPQMFGNSFELVMKHYFAIAFLAVNVLGNFLNVLRTDSSINALDNMIPKIKDEAFKLECSKCQRGVPRRSHHCVLCNICVLNRDHHCFFMNTCIGYFNQKYFVLFCAYNTISGVYATILLALYMHLNYKIVFTSLWTFVILLPSTIVGWWFKTVQPPPSTNLLFLVGLFYAVLFGFILSAGILFWQIYIVSQGQTTYEARFGITQFSRTMKENFVNVFGPHWYINLLLPIMLPQKRYGFYSGRKSGSSSKRKSTSVQPKKKNK